MDQRGGRMLSAALMALGLLTAMAGLPGDTAAPAAGTMPFVSAHRGGAAYAPENTMVAFDNAIRLGVDELEADAQLTVDGHVVLLHDDTLDRTTHCSGTVLSMTLAEVQACDAAFWFSPGQPTTVPDDDAPHPLRGTGVRVPLATDLLDRAVALGAEAPQLSIEIKDIPGEANFDVAGTAVAEALVPLVVERGLVDRVVVQSFWPPALESVRRLEPRLRTQLLTTSTTGQTFLANLAYVTAAGHDVSAPNFDVPDLTPETVAGAHAAGVAVVPYTPDRRSDLEATAALAVDGIITNVPACLLALLGRPVPTDPFPDGVRDHVAGQVDGCVVDEPAVPQPPTDRPDPATCAALRPTRWQPATGAPDPTGRLRVVAMQFKQEVRHVESYETFRTKMRCLMEDHAVPVMDDRPMLVVFNEDIGLMTLATGSRGAAVRAQAETPLGAPAGDAAPAGIATALVEMNAVYAPQVATYQARFGPIDPRKQVFVAATDTFARAFSQTFSDIARDYGVYVVATNNQPRYEASSDPVDIALFADPDLGDVAEVYVATSPVVTNQTVLWGPRDVATDAPAGERNLLFRNDKVPLTSLERDLIALDEGPSTGPAGRANAAGIEIEGFRLGFATSLPAFTWGHPFGERPADLDPCADTRVSFMACMDALGVDTVVQAEANPGRWATYQEGGWQPLEWMESTYRTVADPSAGFRFNITAHMVGNLLDLVFDGQTAITVRGASAPPTRYVGNGAFDEAQDDPAYRRYVGDHPEFLVLAPWVVPDGPRADLAAVATRLAPGSGDALENDYLETAAWADLGPASARPRPVAPPPAAAPPAATPAVPLPTTGARPPMTLAALAGLLASVAIATRRLDPPRSS